MNIKYYSQKDPRWKNIPYTIDGDAIETIGYSGCGPTCAAMLVASVCDPAITPPDMCSYAIETGTRTANDGTDWAFYGKIALRYGLAYRQTVRNAEALECVKAGGVAICSMGPGRWTNGGHYILWYAVDGDYVLVNDPQSTAAARSRAPIADMFAQSKQYFLFYVAAVAAGTEDDMTKEDVLAIIKEYEESKKTQAPSDWSQEARAWAESNGIITGDENGNKQYQSNCTTERMIVFLYRLMNHMKSLLGK